MFKRLREKIGSFFSENVLYVTKGGETLYFYTPSGKIIRGGIEFGELNAEEVVKEYGIDEDTRVVNVNYSDMPRAVRNAFRKAVKENIDIEILLALRHSELSILVSNLDRERNKAIQKSQKEREEKK
jgi:hypothetical protein